MPINKQTKANNGVSVSFHKVVKLEVDMRVGSSIAWVYSWPDEQSCTDGLPHAVAWTHPVAEECLIGSDSLIDKLETALVEGSGAFKAGEIVADATMDINAFKLRKNAEINAARLAANRTSFPFSGKQIACDELSQLDIQSTNGIISLTQAMPTDWPGGWKTLDNSYVAIPDVATWVAFYKAMVAQGTLNFAHSQTLKGRLIAATTIEEVSAIVW